MIVCDKCSTRNVEGSRFCDGCGTALWMAGRSSSSLENGNGNGSNGNSRQPAASVAPSGAQVSAEHVSLTNLQPGNVHATLQIERGVSAGKKFTLSSQESQIGRWDADGGVFPDVDLDSDDPEAKVSRRHARISTREGNYLIEDLGSTNGTFVNRGRRLAPGDRCPLKDGDEIIVGKTFLRFRVAK
jgi:pSer/pThr/pTyr-binding forkhead associated (FHA) protein